VNKHQLKKKLLNFLKRKMKQIKYFLASLLFIVTACEDPVYTPKPRGFPRVMYPERHYQSFDENFCAFTFEYPTYAKITQDTLFFDQKPLDDCWFDIDVPELDARIHCSYYQINKANPFPKLMSDAFTLAGKHNIKADYIDEIRVEKNNRVSGFLFDIQGPAASPFQFYLTDSTKHFMRGALYFKTSARPDSLKPVVEFMKKDIVQMVNTFKWNN
jgi:gliding motility-associated lipoprotein GldD